MDLSNFVEKAKELNVLGVKVSQNGELLGEWYSEPECRRNVYSATKSFTSCAVGFAVQEGLLSLDEKLTEAFAEDLPKEVDENLKKATVRDLLTMCLGQKEGSLMGEQRPLYAEDDWVKLSLSLPFVYEPGTHFVYNNVGPYLAGILVQRRSGCDLVSYLTPRLFKAQAVFSLRFPSFINLASFISIRENGTENSFSRKNGLRRAPAPRMWIITPIFSGGESTIPTGLTANIPSFPSFCRTKTP